MGEVALRPEDQIRELLDRLDTSKDTLPADVRDNLRLAVQLCRLLNDRANAQDDRWENIGLGLKIVAGIGAATTATIGAFAAILEIRKYLG